MGKSIRLYPFYQIRRRIRPDEGKILMDSRSFGSDGSVCQTNALKRCPMIKKIGDIREFCLRKLSTFGYWPTAYPRLLSRGTSFGSEGAFSSSEGAFSSSEGAFSSSEGAFSSSEGAFSSSEGAFSSSEGAFSSSEGAFSSSEGAFSSSEGAFSSSEGAFFYLIRKIRGKYKDFLKMAQRCRDTEESNFLQPRKARKNTKMEIKKMALLRVADESLEFYSKIPVSFSS